MVRGSSGGVSMFGIAWGSGEGPLSRLLHENALDCVFQPIASLRDGAIHAHEALIRGPRAMPLHSPDALLQAARKEGLLLEFELECVAVALRRWSTLRQPGRLFINISAAALAQAVTRLSIHHIVQTMASMGLSPRWITLEITEHEHVHDVAALIEIVREMQASGFSFALDDFGDGRSSLRLWAELMPDIVKVDKYFSRELSAHAKKLQTMRALTQLAEVFGTSLVVEGIETPDDLRAIRDLGIAYGQGYLLGRPAGEPRTEIEPEALAVIEDTRVAVLPAMRSATSPGRLRDLHVVSATTITRETTNDEVMALFGRHADWPALAIADGDAPIGIIERHQFTDRYARGYFKEVYGRRPAVMFANLSPRIVERDGDIRELMAILTSPDQRYLKDGLIITDNGRYVGLGLAEQLVRNVTESRIEAARHANPLTFLPGNIPISEHIGRLLKAGGDFVACYADLADFKPFNDHYGYWRGDEMIKLVAQAALAVVDPQRDFLGHVGGDDFVLLFQSEDWESRCRHLVETFNERARKLYDDEALAAGGIESEDRFGVRRAFGFTRLYVGAVRVAPGQFANAEQVASAAARAKQGAKTGHVGVMVHRRAFGHSELAPLSA